MSLPNHVDPATQRQMETVTRLLRAYSTPYWKSIAVTIALSTIGATLSSIMPLFFAPVLDIALGRSFLDGALSGDNFLSIDLNNVGPILMNWLGIDQDSGKMRAIAIFGAIFFVVSIFSNLLTFAAQVLGRSIQARTARDMQNELFAHIMAMPLAFFSHQRTGELVSRLANDTGATTSGLDKIIRYLISAPLQIIFYSYILARTNLELALVALFAAAVHYAITKALKGTVHRTTVRQYAVFANLSVVIQEAVSGIRLIKSFAAEAFEIGKFRRITESIVGATMRQFFAQNVQEPLRSLANQAVGLCILIFSANELIAGRLEASGFIMFVYMGQRLIGSVKLLGDTLATMHVTAAAAERVVSLMANRPQIKDGGVKDAMFTQAIVMNDIVFAYESMPVLNGVNLRINKGEMIALVGPSGAGKTTLVDLLLRLHDPCSGSILMDGKDIREFSQSAFRNLFGVVSQDTFLFNTTIYENIVYGRQGISDADVREAARTANALSFIDALPEGFDTIIGDRGVKLSGGQRQRLAIARAIVAHPQILVMDEATSALDSESERLVQEAIDRVVHNSTAIVIAHRLSTVMHASRILVLDHGMVADCGTHSELLERCPLYARLCKLQFNAAAPINSDATPV